jgi:hypothetical protein
MQVSEITIMQLSELKIGEKDAAGIVVFDIYTINSKCYAVYRTKARVMVQFADDHTLAESQRQKLASLAALRGQINSLIDGWYNSKSDELKKRAEHLDRRVADALITALEGDQPNASEILTEIRNEVIVDRKSRARFLYLISASLAALIFTIALVIVCLIRHSPNIEYGVAGGILGAFFSISIGIRSRTIRTDLHWRDNTSDAVLRVAVGMIAGFVIVCLYRLGFIDWLKFPQSLTSSLWMPNFILGFLGGFAERLIPDLLSKVASGNGSAIPEQDAAVNASKKPVDTSTSASVSGTAVATTSVPHAEDNIDSCLCDAQPVAGEEVTLDSDLPVATGGVTRENVAPSPPPQSKGV